MRRHDGVTCASCEYVRVASEMGTEGGAYQVARCMHPSGCGAWLEKAIRSELMMWMSPKESWEESVGRGTRGDWLMTYDTPKRDRMILSNEELEEMDGLIEQTDVQAAIQAWLESRTIRFPWALEHRPVMRKIGQVENSILYKEHECLNWLKQEEQDCEDWSDADSWGELPDTWEHQFPKVRVPWNVRWVAENEEKEWKKLMKLVEQRERNGGPTDKEIEDEIERQCAEYDEMEQNRCAMEDWDDNKLLVLMRPAA